jgi:acetyl/propionyl-CoA carboxylase alpha subunit
MAPGWGRRLEAAVKYVATVAGTPTLVELAGGEGRYRLTIGDEVWEVDARLNAQGFCTLLVGGVSHVADVVDRDGTCVVDVGGETYEVRVEEQTRWIIRTRGGAAGGGQGQTLTAPLPGKITHVAVRAGDPVRAGDTLVVIEAMKMENEFKAAAAGTVAEVRVQPGQAVNPGDVLVVVVDGGGA